MLRQVRRIGTAPPDCLKVTRFRGLLPPARGEIKPCLRRVPSRPFCLCCSWSRDPVCSLSSLACGDVLCCLIQSATLRLSIARFSPLIPKFLMGSSEASLERCSQKHPDPGALVEFYHDGTGRSSKSPHLCDAALVWHQLHPALASRPPGPPGGNSCFSSRPLASTPMRFVPLP